MIESGLKTHIIAAELGDMLRLAETSTATIDSTLESIDRARTQAYSASLIAICLTFWLFFLSGDLVGSVGRMFALAGCGFGYSIFFYRYHRRLRKLDSTIAIEFRMRSRLLSLIDEQFKRVLNSEELSPIARVTLELRIQRLDRSYWEGKS